MSYDLISHLFTDDPEICICSPLCRSIFLTFVSDSFQTSHGWHTITWNGACQNHPRPHDPGFQFPLLCQLLRFSSLSLLLAESVSGPTLSPFRFPVSCHPLFSLTWLSPLFMLSLPQIWIIKSTS